jgi:hypothetical protein
MDREQIICMAREAGWLSEYDSPTGFCAEAAFKFAALVAEHERNACAKVVEDYCGAWNDKGYALASAIRARSEQ